MSDEGQCNLMMFITAIILSVMVNRCTMARDVLDNEYRVKTLEKGCPKP